MIPTDELIFFRGVETTNQTIPGTCKLTIDVSNQCTHFNHKSTGGTLHVPNKKNQCLVNSIVFNNKKPPSNNNQEMVFNKVAYH